MGDSFGQPPNTLAAIASAIAAGADMVEVDVSITEDEVLVATHGPRLDHWTDGRGHVHRMPWAVIQELRARHSRGGAFSEEGVPSFAQVLETVDGQVPLNVDVKRQSAADAAIRAVGERQQAYVISGLIPRQVRGVLGRHSGVPVLVNLGPLDKLIAKSSFLRTRWLCRGRQRRLLQHPDVVALNINHEWVDDRLVAAVHGAGAQVWVFTVTDTEGWLRAATLRVDSITVDDPKRHRGPDSPSF